MALFDRIPKPNYEPIINAIHYLRSLPELGKTILIGGLLLNYGTTIILPAFFVMGFIVQIIQHIDKKGESEDSVKSLPRFEDWSGLFAEGISAYTIWSIYTLLAFIGVTPFVNSRKQTWEVLFTIISTFSGGTLVPLLVSLREFIAGGVANPSFTSTGISALILNPEFVLFLIVMYVAPAGFINFSKNGAFSAGFDLNAIRQILRSPSYGFRWTIFMGLWFVSSLLLFAPTDPIQSTFATYGIGAVGWIIREMFETVVSFISFTLLLLGFILLGFANTDAQPHIMETVLRFRYFPGSQLAKHNVNYTELSKTYIIGGLALGLGSLIGTVLVGGYIIRVLREPPDKSGMPDFDGLYAITIDGFRFVFIWVIYSTPIWTLFYLTGFPWQYSNVRFEGISIVSGYTFTLQNYMNAQTFYTGIISGSPYTARDFSNVVWQILLKADLYQFNVPQFEIANHTIATGSLVFEVELAYWLLATVVLYLFPASLLCAIFADSVLAGFNLRKLYPILTSRNYLWRWSLAMGYWLIGGTLALLWNEWQVAVGKPHSSSLIEIEGFSLIRTPTNFGLLSTSTLFLLGLVMFLLVVKGYLHITETMHSHD